jgi:ribonuclease HI
VTPQKYYVVWKGRNVGIFTSWPDCEKQVKGFVGAQYKAFGSMAEARLAQEAGYERYRGRSASHGKWKRVGGGPRLPSISVDAACSGSPGRLEYRGVDTESGRQLFRSGPFAQGTNNVGEFLAIVQALRWLREHGKQQPVYSDSLNAIGWVRTGKCGTKLKRTSANRSLFDLIARGEAELPALLAPPTPGSDRPRILKWETREWGEIPADFGRK